MHAILTPGDPVPWFRGRTALNPDFDFSSAAGRHIVLSCLPPGDGEMLAVFLANADAFNDVHSHFFGVVSQPPGGAPAESERRPGMDLFWDSGGELARLLGALPVEGGNEPFEPVTYV